MLTDCNDIYVISVYVHFENNNYWKPINLLLIQGTRYKPHNLFNHDEGDVPT
jgi:hypothetical protein